MLYWVYAKVFRYRSSRLIFIPYGRYVGLDALVTEKAEMTATSEDEVWASFTLLTKSANLNAWPLTTTLGFINGKNMFVAQAENPSLKEDLFFDEESGLFIPYF